ncbi:MAG TPA: phosphoribosylformylglycinamidine synthase subunit PurS [Micavibrio sp.]
MKAYIHVTLKKGVLDPQGKAIAQALHGMGFDEVAEARQGKTIELDLAEGTDIARIEQMCEKLLANTVVEDYRIELA